jgi:hypothetical protein
MNELALVVSMIFANSHSIVLPRENFPIIRLAQMILKPSRWVLVTWLGKFQIWNLKRTSTNSTMLVKQCEMPPQIQQFPTMHEHGTSNTEFEGQNGPRIGAPTALPFHMPQERQSLMRCHGQRSD